MSQGKNMHHVDTYAWGSVYADDRDPDAGGASHEYAIHLDKPSVGDLEPGVIRFQHGPRNVEGSTRGILDDHLLAIAEDRLAAFQAGPFAHPSNERALAYVRAARAALRERAEERRARGVLGKNLA